MMKVFFKLSPQTETIEVKTILSLSRAWKGATFEGRHFKREKNPLWIVSGFAGNSVSSMQTTSDCSNLLVAKAIAERF